MADTTYYVITDTSSVPRAYRFDPDPQKVAMPEATFFTCKNCAKATAVEAGLQTFRCASISRNMLELLQLPVPTVFRAACPKHTGPCHA